MADRTIQVTIAGDASKLNAALGSAQKSLDTTNKHLSSVSKGAKQAAEAFVLFEGAKKAAEFLKGAAEAAIENESAMRRVGVAVKNAGENFKTLQEPLDKNLEKMATTTGFVKTDLQESFAKLESVTKNHIETLKLEHDAMNISAQRGISLSAATKAVMQSYVGSTTAARRLGVVTAAVTTAHDAVKSAFEKLARTQDGQLTPSQKALEAQEMKAAKAADKQATSTSVLDKIHKTFAGAVAARTDTMAGKVAIFQEKWQAIKVKVGDAIMPALLKAIDPLLVILDKLSNLSSTWKTVILAVGGALTTMAAGLLIWAAAVKVATIAQEAWDAAMAASTIGLIVVGIAALVAALVILYQRSATFRAIVNGAFSAIKQAGEAAFGFLTNTVFPAFTNAWNHSAGVIGVVVGSIKGYINGVREMVEGAFNFVGDLIHGRWSKLWGDAVQIIKGYLGMMESYFLTIPKAILTHLGAIEGAAKSLGSAVFNGIVGAVQNLPGALGNVISAGLSALKSLIESFHVTVKTKTYLGVPVPVGMSLGFGGGGGGQGTALGLDVPANGGLAPLPGGSKPRSFLNGNLPRVPGSGRGSYTPTVPATDPNAGGGSDGGGGGSSKVADHLKKLADLAEAARSAIQSKLDAAFNHVADYTMKAFDGKTSAHLAKLASDASKAAKKIQDDLNDKLKGLTDANANLTPAEAALKALQDAHNQQGLTDATNTAASDLATATASGDPAAIKAAQKAVDDAAYAQQVQDLGAKAALERKAANDQLAIDTKAAQDEAARKQAAADADAKQAALTYQAQRDTRKDALKVQLDDLQAHLDAHPKLWASTHAKIMKMFDKDFGPDFTTAGVNIGTAYIKGLKQAFADVDPLASEAEKKTAAANKAAGKVPKNALGGIYYPRPGGQTITVAEAGRAEMVVPLGAGAGAASSQHFYLNTTGLDEASLARKMWRQSRLAVT